MEAIFSLAGMQFCSDSPIFCATPRTKMTLRRPAIGVPTQDFSYVKPIDIISLNVPSHKYSRRP